ncbi:spermatogenesis-associated protein 31E1-like [Kogia breviceps]|uniref:spermatogenesis-associated protein 31E1-like n=1 Tax=Kogia breviceps TaxID=27615 RepID=UPI0034D376A1
MENPLFSLKSTFDTWLNTSSTFWAIDTIFAFLCALGLFFLLLPYLQNNPSSPPPRKHGNIRKHQMEPRGRRKLKKKNKALKACGACREELEEVRALLSLLQSHLERLLDKGSFHQPSCQDPPGEACKAASAGADQPCREPAEEAVPATCPSAALAPLTQGSLPVASTLSTEPQDQSNLKRITLGTAAKSSTPGNSFWATVILAILSVGLAFYRVLFLSLWRKTTKALFFPTSSQSEPPQEHLAHQPPEAPFLAGPTDKQVETGSLSFVNPEVQKLLQILITKNAKLKICKGKEKDGSFSEQMSSDYLSNIQKQHLQKRLIKANFAKFLGKPQPRQGMKVVTKATGPTLVSPLPVPSPEHTEIQRARGKASPGDMSGPSEAPLTGQEDRLPYQMSTVNLMGRSWENGTVLGFPATRKTLSPPTKSVAQHPKEPRLKTQVAQGCATGELLQDSHTDILLQDDAIGMPLQDSATNVLLQGSHTDVLLADMLASRRSLSSSQREHASEDAPAFRVAPRDLNVSEQSSQGQQKFRKPKLKDSFKSEGEMLAPAEEWRCVRRLQPGEHEETRSNQGQQEPRKPTVRDPRKGQFASTDGRKDDRRPKPGEYEERSSGWQASQASGMSHASQVRERGESLGSKHPQPSPGKRRLLPEKQNWLGYFLRLLSPNQKDKGIEESVQKGKPASSTAQHQKPIRGKSVVESRAVDPWAIGRAVGQVPVKKMGLRQGLCASDLNQHPKQFQAPAEGHSHYHRLLSSSEKRRVLKDTAYSHQASPQDHSYHNKSRHTRGRGDKLASPPRGLESPVRPCQDRPRVAGDSGQLHHHPTCPQKCVPSGQRKCASHAFPGRKVVHEKAEFMQRKPASFHVNTLSMC